LKKFESFRKPPKWWRRLKVSLHIIKAKLAKDEENGLLDDKTIRKYLVLITSYFRYLVGLDVFGNFPFNCSGAQSPTHKSGIRSDGVYLLIFVIDLAPISSSCGDHGTLPYRHVCLVPNDIRQPMESKKKENDNSALVPDMLMFLKL